MSGVLWGLVGAGLIGVSDCVARVTTPRVSMSVLLAFVMGGSTAALTVWLLFAGGWPQWHAYGWGVSAVSGILNLVALGFIYTALARGPVAVASPAASSFTVLLVGLNILAGEPFDWRQVVAALVVFFGIAMLARRARRGTEALEDYDAAWLRLTALLGLAAALAVSVRMFLAQEAAVVLGAFDALYLNRLFAVIGAFALLAWQALRQVPLVWPRRRTLGLVVVQTVLETAALGAFLVGSAGSGRVGAAIGFSAFAAVTALTAWVWLGDRVGPRRIFWMGVVASGVAVAVLYAPATAARTAGLRHAAGVNGYSAAWSDAAMTAPGSAATSPSSQSRNASIRGQSARLSSVASE